MLIRASIIGASGYTGIELVRILAAHPNVELSLLVSERYEEEQLTAVYPHLTRLVMNSFCNLDIEKIAAKSDVVFLALPHTKAAVLAEQLLEKKCKVIDLSADLRLNDGEVYSKWYNYPAAKTDVLANAVYGLAEIGLRTQIANARLIANPGCYSTATILGLAPLLANNCTELTKQPLIIDAKSGVSGAGRSLNLTTHFCEAMNNFSAYQIGGIHRHIPEIEQELSKIAGQEIIINFTPHLIPSVRGILITAYCQLKAEYNLAQIYQLYHQYYQDSFFVRVIEDVINPGIKAVVGSNFCNISLYLDKRTNCLTIISTIDNLLKGASGQAIQNMNLMYKLAENTGLMHAGIYP